MQMRRLILLLASGSLILFTSTAFARFPARNKNQRTGPRVKLTYSVPMAKITFSVPAVGPGGKRSIFRAPVTVRGGIAERLQGGKSGKPLPDTVLRVRRSAQSVSVDLGIERITGFGSTQRTKVRWLGHGSFGLPRGYTLVGEDKGGEVTFGLTRNSR